MVWSRGEDKSIYPVCKLYWDYEWFLLCEAGNRYVSTQPAFAWDFLQIFFGSLTAALACFYGTRKFPMRASNRTEIVLL